MSLMMDAQKYQIMAEAAQPETPSPRIVVENTRYDVTSQQPENSRENGCLCFCDTFRFTHLVVDIVRIDDVTTFEVIFAASLHGSIEKRVVIDDVSGSSCLVERIALSRRDDVTRVTSMQLVTSSGGVRRLLVSTEKELIQLPLARCERFHTQQ